MFSSSFHWDSLLPLWKNSCRWVDYHMSSSSTVSSCNRCFQRNRVMMCVQLQLRSTSCLWALVSGEAYLPVRGASGGPALSLQLQWNNYDWCAETSSQEYLLYYLFSQSPGSGGENTYKLPASLLSSSLMLLLAEVLARSLALFLSFLFFHSLLFCLPRCVAGSIHRGPEALTVWPTSCGRTILALIFIIFFIWSLVVVFLV